MTDLRLCATEYAKHFIGTFYKWGGDDPSGFDCSGFVCEILQSVGKIGRKEDFNAAALRAKFAAQVVTKPAEGCLVFYAAQAGGPIIHVEYCLNEFQSIGASGGGSTTLTVEDAIKDNAFIKVRTIYSRAHIVAFCDPFQ